MKFLTTLFTGILLLQVLPGNNILYLKQQVKSDPVITVNNLFNNSELPAINLNLPLYDTYNYFTKNEIIFHIRKKFPMITNYTVIGTSITIHKNKGYSEVSSLLSINNNQQINSSLFYFEKSKIVDNSVKTPVKSFYFPEIAGKSTMIPKDSIVFIQIQNNAISVSIEGRVLNDTHIGDIAEIKKINSGKIYREYLTGENCFFVPVFSYN